MDYNPNKKKKNNDLLWIIVCVVGIGVSTVMFLEMFMTN